MPNLLSFPTSCVCLELRPLPSTGITRLLRYYEPRRHPKAPGLSLTGVRLVIPAPRQGASRVACVSLVYMLSPLPRHSDWAYDFALPPSRISLPRNGVRVGLRIVLFEACSVFTRVTACTLAGPPEVVRYIEGFSYLVTSITAPIASGWSEIAGWDFHPLGKRRLCTAHANCGHSQSKKTRPCAGFHILYGDSVLSRLAPQPARADTKVATSDCRGRNRHRRRGCPVEPSAWLH